MRRAAGRPGASILFSLFVVGLVGFMSVVRGRSHGSRTCPSEIVAAAVSDFMWDTVAGPPIPAAVGAGGVEGFVGRIRTRGDDTLWIVAFEGSKLGQVWKAGPLGTYSQAYQSTFATRRRAKRRRHRLSREPARLRSGARATRPARSS